jgi:hypothetical protein
VAAVSWDTSGAQLAECIFSRPLTAGEEWWLL